MNNQRQITMTTFYFLSGKNLTIFVRTGAINTAREDFVVVGTLGLDPLGQPPGGQSGASRIGWRVGKSWANSHQSKNLKLYRVLGWARNLAK